MIRAKGEEFFHASIISLKSFCFGISAIVLYFARGLFPCILALRTARLFLITFRLLAFVYFSDRRLRLFWLTRWKICLVSDAPSQVTILGPTEAKVGDVVHLNCTTAVSNPASSIKWTIDGRQVHNTTYKPEAVPNNGWISSSVISIPITADRSNIIVICHAVNSYVEGNVVTTHNINVLC